MRSALEQNILGNFLVTVNGNNLQKGARLLMGIATYSVGAESLNAKWIP